MRKFHWVSNYQQAYDKARELGLIDDNWVYVNTGEKLNSMNMNYTGTLMLRYDLPLAHIRARFQDCDL